jgi:hypothetical protein
VQSLLQLFAQHDSAGAVRVHLIVNGRHIEGHLVTYHDFVREAELLFDASFNGAAATELPAADGWIYLRDAKDPEGGSLGWFACAPAAVTAFSVEPPRKGTSTTSKDAGGKRR